MYLVGAHPQTGQPIDCFDCADQWASVLTIEAAKETRPAVAAIQSFRNDMVRRQRAFIALVTRPRLEAMGHGVTVVKEDGVGIRAWRCRWRRQ